MKAIDRLMEYLHIKGIKPSAFERNNELSNGYLATMKKRGSDVGESTLIKIMDACPDLDSMWLLRGEGSMFASDNKKPSDVMTQLISKEYEAAMSEVYESALSKKETEIRDLYREVASLKAELSLIKSGK